jgi:hypothetical protein
VVWNMCISKTAICHPRLRPVVHCYQQLMAGAVRKVSLGVANMQQIEGWAVSLWSFLRKRWVVPDFPIW